jgi:hypothetical protein
MGENTADSIIAAVTKFAWPIAGITALTSGTILFWPSAVVLFKLNSLPKWMLDYAGLAFIVSAAILICLLGKQVYEFFSSSIKEKNYKNNIKQRLESLNWDEQAILREFFLSGSNVINLPYQHPAVLSLRNQRILFLAAKSAIVYGYQMDFPHQLPSGVKDLIEPEMIDLPKAERLYNTDRAQFEAFRPEFRQPRGYY